MNKVSHVIFMVLLLTILFPFFIDSQVFAQCPSGEVGTDLGCVPSDPIGFVERFYAIGLGFIGSVGILFMIIGGYYIMTSAGNVTKLQTGKSYIFYAFAGIMLAVLGFVFIQVVTGDILKIPGFS